MATEVETLMVRLEASAAKFEREMDRARTSAFRVTRDIESRMDSSMKAILSSAQTGAAGVNAALSGIGAGGVLSVAGIAAFSDQYARLINQMKGADIGNPAQAIGDVAKAAISAGAPLADTAALFRELMVAGKETGAGYAENIALTQTLAKAMTAEGKTAAETGDALRSLSDELKYGEGKASDYLEILQESPRLFDAVAKAIGTTKDKLREQINEEEIGAGKIQQAILKAAPIVDANFAAAFPQAATALANLGTAVQLYIGQTANGIANSQALAAVITVVSNNFGVLAGSAIAVGEAIAVVLVGRAIIPMIASLGAAGVAAIVNFTAAVGTMGVASATAAVGVGALQAAVGLLLSPVTLTIAAIAGLAGVLYQMQAAQDPAKAAAENHTTALKDLDQAIRLVSEAAPKTVAAVRQLGAAQLEQADAAIRNAQANVAAAKAMLEAAQAMASLPNFSAFGGQELLRDAANAGEINSAAGKIAQAEDALTARFKEQSAVKEKLVNFDKDLAEGKFKFRQKPAASKPEDSSSGGGASADKKNAFDREIEQFNKKISLLQVEKDTLGMLTAEREKAKAVIELTQAAERAGITLSDEQRAKIEQLATSYGAVQQSLESARAAQQQFRDLQQFIGASLSGFFSDIVSGGKNAQDALMNLTKKLADAALQAALLGQGPLAGLFNTSGTRGGMGGLIGGLFGLFTGGVSSPSASTAGFAGPVARAATGTSYVPYDNMPTLLHRGEIVIPKYDSDIIRRGGVGGGSARHLNVSISLDGANGNREVEEIAYRAAQQGVSAAMAGEQSRNAAYAKRVAA